MIVYVNTKLGQYIGAKLWHVKDEAAIINLALDSNKNIVLEDTVQQATYESTPIEANHFNELVL